ncbi:hypothetical protein LL965_22210 [Xanthomonas cassavae CFBP 4642]|uniref:Transposase n=1 Tax=Xanthomonas cassavae CFBP 4642 TaxID=1219375 RepID=A0ABS8HK94_9XANT|nr:hypothetical protein [Xanthomonas cassavae]MCC4622618.1 hypothetical protein [Xanthomonas cassavae CFBP 4642]
MALFSPLDTDATAAFGWVASQHPGKPKNDKQERTYGFRFSKTVRRRQVVGAVAVGHLVELLALLNRAKNPET